MNQITQFDRAKPNKMKSRLLYVSVFVFALIGFVGYAALSIPSAKWAQDRSKVEILTSRMQAIVTGETPAEESIRDQKAFSAAKPAAERAKKMVDDQAAAILADCKGQRKCVRDGWRTLAEFITAGVAKAKDPEVIVYRQEIAHVALPLINEELNKLKGK